MFTGCYWWWRGIWAYLNHLANILHNRVPFIILSSPASLCLCLAMDIFLACATLSHTILIGFRFRFKQYMLALSVLFS